MCCKLLYPRTQGSSLEHNKALFPPTFPSGNRRIWLRRSTDPLGLFNWGTGLIGGTARRGVTSGGLAGTRAPT
jgi:hypothetical protein